MTRAKKTTRLMAIMLALLLTVGLISPYMGVSKVYAEGSEAEEMLPDGSEGGVPEEDQEEAAEEAEEVVPEENQEESKEEASEEKAEETPALMKKAGKAVMKAPALRSGSITTWAALKEAINGGATEVTIGADLFADGDTIEISSNVTIKGSGTIYRGRKDGMDSLFKVKSGGNLTIEGGVTLSGKEYTCAQGTVEKVPGTVTQNKPEPLPELEDYKQAGTGSVDTVSGPYRVTLPGGGSVTNYAMVSGDGSTFNVDSSGHIYIQQDGTRYLTYRNSNAIFSTNPSGDYVYLVDSSGNKVTSSSSLVANTEYALMSEYWSNSGTVYLVLKNDSIIHDRDATFSTAAKLTADSGSGGDTWVIPDASGQDQTYDNEDDARDALAALIERESTWTVTGNGLSLIHI